MTPWTLLQKIPMRQDLILVVVLITAIVMMILPLPTLLVDVFLAANLAMTVLLLMVAVYLKNPLDFSTLPSVILLATVFRLALSITTTRLILSQADAGEIVEAFGSFVVAGNLVVGLVVFLIITIVQFVVITKGSERIAEVAARFTLDALPGKQMSIDADLRNNDIDQEEARRKRRYLEKESQLYGAMDGAMKFVKGDAIAGLVIIAVNLLGGIAVGTLQHGLAVGEAMTIYSLLTIGDGLVMQIPALFVSISAGAIVTRVTTDESTNLGTDIAAQMVADGRSLPIAAVVLLLLSFVPGFPTAVFIFLAAIFGGIALSGYLAKRKLAQKTEEGQQAAALHDQEMATNAEPQTPEGPIRLALSNDLHDVVQGTLQGRLDRVQHKIYDDLGITVPPVSVIRPPSLAKDRYRIDLDEIPTAEGKISPDHFLLRDDPDHLELVDIKPMKGGRFLNQAESLWVEQSHEGTLRDAGIGFWMPDDVLAALLEKALKDNASHLLGIQETQSLLQRLEKSHADLSRAAQGTVPLQKMTEIFRRLLSEQVSLKNLRLILDALVEWGQKEQDVAQLTEYVRSSLKRQISHAYADDNKIIAAYLLERSLEQKVREAVRQTSVGDYLTLPEQMSEKLIGTIRKLMEQRSSDQAKAVLLTSMDVRRFVRNFLIKNSISLPVLSHQDLSPEYTVQPIAVVRFDVGVPRAPLRKTPTARTEESTAAE